MSPLLFARLCLREGKVDESELVIAKHAFQVRAATALQSLMDEFEASTGEMLHDVYVTITDRRTDLAVPDGAQGATPRTISVSVRLRSALDLESAVVAPQILGLTAAGTPEASA